MGSSSSSAAGAASDGRDVGKTPSMQGTLQGPVVQAACQRHTFASLVRAGGDFAEVMKVHLQRLIVYAQDTHSGLQRPVAERLGKCMCYRLPPQAGHSPFIACLSQQTKQ